MKRADGRSILMSKPPAVMRNSGGLLQSVIGVLLPKERRLLYPAKERQAPLLDEFLKLGDYEADQLRGSERTRKVAHQSLLHFGGQPEYGEWVQFPCAEKCNDASGQDNQFIIFTEWENWWITGHYFEGAMRAERH